MSFKDLMTYKRILIRHIYTSVISWWVCIRACMLVLCILDQGRPACMNFCSRAAFWIRTDKPAWISAAENGTTLRRRQWVTSTATTRGRCSSRSKPTTEFQFLEWRRERWQHPGESEIPVLGSIAVDEGRPCPTQRTVLPPCSLTTDTSCCIFQRFKFRKFGKFRLLELVPDRTIINHEACIHKEK